MPTESKKHILTKKDYMAVTYRSYFLQNSFNYSNYQGVGYANVMYPVLKKLYGHDDELFKTALKENLTFYNTNPQTLPFITTLHATMLDNGNSNDEARSLKMALMGPLSGIGDSLSQFTIAPLFSTIGATMAANGMAFGPLFFFIGINLTLFSLKSILGYSGWKFGTTVIADLDSYISQIVDFSTKVGVAVIAGLSVTMVKLYTPIAWSQTIAETGEVQTIQIQAMLNAILPAMLPLMFVSTMFYLIKKKNLSTTKLVIITVVFAIIFGNLGLITNVNPLG